MRKLIKYEIRETYKFMLAIITIILIASTVLQTKISKILLSGFVPATIEEDQVAVLIGIGLLVIFSAIVATFIYIINSYRKELEQNRGYLTFTLPVSGNKILGSKLMVALFWYIVIGLILILFNLGLAKFVFSINYQTLMNVLVNDLNVRFIPLFVTNIISVLIIMTLVYLAVTLSRVTIKNRKIGGIWFIVFLAIFFAVFVGLEMFTYAAPYYLNINNFSIARFSNLQSIVPQWFGTIMHQEIGTSRFLFLGTDSNMYINIFGLIARFVVIATAYFTTGYLLEKKIDL